MSVRPELDEEARFMSEFTWKMLLGLHDKLKLRKKLRLRNVDRDIVIGGDAEEAIKLLYAVYDLSYVVREILRRIQVELFEELEISRGSARGRVITGLVAKHLPVAIPVKRTKLRLETPANLLLAATLAEIHARLLELISHLQQTKLEPKILGELAERRLRDLIGRCEYLLYEPVLRPLLARARLIAADNRSLTELEKTVSIDALRRPREYRAYLRLLKLRKHLRKKLHLLKEEITKLGEKLCIGELSLDKLYELYGFTLLLKALVEELKLTNGDVTEDERALIFELKNGSNVRVYYNVLPNDVESRLARSKAEGLIDGELARELVRRLHGIPDTVIIKNSNGEKRKFLVEYKYTRSYNYLVQARFKVLAYLYEFNADCAVLVAPTPRVEEGGDEETSLHKGFYSEIAKYQGATIWIDSNGKVLAVIYADPNENAVDSSIKAMEKIIKLAL
ncbi:hypothetical protein [Candidatus Methanodesulfokora washburnensis]|uniref:Uncharacterized protein n=2 Tax=Candidatus Methanodesulfokora washburnensis TaxID=2478471 RepID=A0A520KL53_9CREN|nr:hypothetical protein [Candidatus Methanodesulfokores washburnensis]RZN61975.1 MAG: hypothetical protein EF810_03930 [Candidatus Methanodesulfokores washburnensis]